MKDPRIAISDSEIQNIFEFALDCLADTRLLTAKAIETGFEREEKADKSIVTSLDRGIDLFLRERISKRFPNHGIISEEFPPHQKGANFTWIIDPIDGTEEFANGLPLFGTIIGCFLDGAPIVGILDHPQMHFCAKAAFGKGAFANDKKIHHSMKSEVPEGRERISIGARVNFIRSFDQGELFERVTKHFPNMRVFRTCYGHALAALGMLDGQVEVQVSPWDMAASQIITEEAGGTFISMKPSFEPLKGEIVGAIFGRTEVVTRLVNVVGSDLLV